MTKCLSVHFSVNFSGAKKLLYRAPGFQLEMICTPRFCDHLNEAERSAARWFAVRREATEQFEIVSLQTCLMGSGINCCGLTAVWTTSSHSLCIWAVEIGQSVILFVTGKWDIVAHPGVLMTLTIMLNMETSSASNDSVSLTPRCFRAAAVSGCSLVIQNSHY